MSSLGSVTYWLNQLQAGDTSAAKKLWEYYLQRLVELARQKLQGAPRRAADEEDVALSAFDSFCRGAENGRFPELFDRDSLWRLLVALTARKAVDLRRHETRYKRGGTLDGESGLARPPRLSSAEEELEQILSREPTPEFAAQVAEECQRLLSLLKDASLRAVALRKMEGYTTEEIAVLSGCVPRTVERKLQVIRRIWNQEPDS
jgi:DNA-directed RNA polymerase specialized sigma24 family protein